MEVKHHQHTRVNFMVGFIISLKISNTSTIVVVAMFQVQELLQVAQYLTLLQVLRIGGHDYGPVFYQNTLIYDIGILTNDGYNTMLNTRVKTSMTVDKGGEGGRGGGGGGPPVLAGYGKIKDKLTILGL